jgi:hypothetical protein
MEIFQRTLSLSASVSKAGAKVRLFSEPAKLFVENLRFLCRFSASLDFYQDGQKPTP